MKSHLSFLFLLISCFAIAQTPPSNKNWDKSKSGSGADVPVKLIPLNVGSVLLAASSSGVGPNKSEPNRDPTNSTFDYWLIRLDDAGNTIWEKTFGGTEGDNPSPLLIMPDGGYLLCGNSYSGLGADKSDSCRGGDDFWIVRTDSLGNKLWDKTIGGNGVDLLGSATLTTKGFIVLAGSTLSGVGGDKTSAQVSVGSFDFWMVWLDGSGNIIYDKTYGGPQNDNCYSITAALDGGVLLGGISDSQVGGNKQQPPRGLNDYWVLKTDTLARILWSNTYGGSSEDYLYTVQNGPSGSYLIGGDSYSPIGFDKTATPKGSDDMWVLRISNNGAIIWDQTYGSTDSDELNEITITNDGNFLLTGESYSQAGDDKSENNLGIEQIWMVNIDSNGVKQWDKTFFTTGHDEGGLAVQSQSGCYIGCISTLAGIGGYKSTSNFGNLDCWIAELCVPISGLEESESYSTVLVYPNPSTEMLNVKTVASTNNVIQLYNQFGQLVKEERFNSNQVSINMLDLADGLYLVVLNGSQSSSKKIVLQKK
jgi:hypothetical protein